MVKKKGIFKITQIIGICTLYRNTFLLQQYHIFKQHNMYRYMQDSTSVVSTNKIMGRLLFNVCFKHQTLK